MVTISEQVALETPGHSLSRDRPASGETRITCTNSNTKESLAYLLLEQSILTLCAKFSRKKTLLCGTTPSSKEPMKTHTCRKN